MKAWNQGALAMMLRGRPFHLAEFESERFEVLRR